MTAHRGFSGDEASDSDATVKMPRPTAPNEAPADATDDEHFDPERTLVREDWESTVIRRIAPRVVEIVEASGSEDAFGWESESLKRLADEVQKSNQ